MRFPFFAALTLVCAASAFAAIKSAEEPAVDQPQSSQEQPQAATVPAASTAPGSDSETIAAPAPAAEPGEQKAAAPSGPDSPDSSSRPSPLLRLSGLHRHAVLVDLPRSRLFLLENTAQGLKVIRQYYAAMGKNGYGKQAVGDNRTPVGVYTVSGYMGAGMLPEFYGSGAFPLSYPNDWDFHKKRTGSGIWLHGVPPNTYTRAPRSSEGCVTMANEDLIALRPYLKPAETPIVLTDQLEWTSATTLNSASNVLGAQIENWRSKWSAIDTDGYLDFYADEFTSAGLDKAAFAEYKRRVNASKKHIAVSIRDLDLFAYPGEDALVLAQFNQDYAGDHYRATTRKQQYWRRQADGNWKIVLEENH